MRVKCEYCHGEMDDKSPYCPNCGAPNHNIHQTVDGTPKTIEELKQWYIKRNLPPAETTRFFIGVDYKKPKAFGIYKDSNTGEFIVYKNKADGSRAIRYQGCDEAYAVNELYMKLKSEILNQKELNSQKRSNASQRDVKGTLTTIGIVVAFIAILFILIIIDDFFNGFGISFGICIVASPIIFVLLSSYLRDKGIFDTTSTNRRGILSFVVVFIAVFCILFAPIHSYSTAKYYVQDSSDEIYCKYHNDWYVYDYTNHLYTATDKPVDAVKTPVSSLYTENDDWNYSSFTEFKDSGSYDYYYPSSSDSDSDYNWSSSDSWDSSGTDWNSDW